MSHDPVLRAAKLTSCGQMWDEQYIRNLAKYYKQVEEYKAGRPIPDLLDISRPEVDILVEKYIPKTRFDPNMVADTVAGNGSEEAEEEDQEDAEEDEEEDREPSAPPKAPSPKATKRRKTAKDAAEAKKASLTKEPLVPVPTSSGKKAPTTGRLDATNGDDVEEEQIQKPKTPEKKKRATKKAKDSLAPEHDDKTKKAAAEELRSSPKGDSQGSQKKEKKSRKKRQSEVTIS